MSVKILLVEDNYTSARTTCDLMEYAGHECSAVTTVDQAERKMSKEDFDVILLDLGLPDAHGLDGLRRLRRITQTPIVILTGQDEELAQKALKLGAQDFLSKSDITIRILERAISYAIARDSFLSSISKLNRKLHRARNSR